ncbi:OadG family protein [Caproicibacter sp.]|uniref:OadG family protein n=1 Tax=Caproicibacter sp. TaxID=2814884 RepID=UPI0039893974
MWTEASMNLIQSLTVSGLGLTIVFLTLIILALAILGFSKIFSAAGISKGTGAVKENSAAQQAPTGEKEEDDVLAILIAVISEEMNLPVDRFQITKIQEI